MFLGFTCPMKFFSRRLLSRRLLLKSGALSYVRKETRLPSPQGFFFSNINVNCN
jgi:hypothetical protein